MPFVLRKTALKANIPIIPTQFEVAALWESGSSKLRSKFIKTRSEIQSVTFASFEYRQNTISQLSFTALGRGGGGSGLAELTLPHEKGNDEFAQSE